MKRKLKYLGLMAVACIAFMTACMYLDSISIDQPQEDGTMAPQIKAGEVATFKINGYVAPNADQKSRFVVAMLAPRGWNIAQNAEVSFTGTQITESPDHVYTMKVIPANEAPKNMPGLTWPDALMQRLGLGPNRYNDMEWVAWQADEAIQAYNGSHADYEVTLKVKVGPENLKAGLGFFINNIDDGLTGDDRYYKYMFSDAFTVYGGTGEEIDYTSVRFYSVEPSRSLQDDIITFTFDGDAYDNPLSEEPEIYMECAAVTESGNRYPGARIPMIRESVTTHSYSATLWPVGHFGIPEGETVTDIEYSFTNGNGTIVINKSYEMEVSGKEHDSDDIPFSFTLRC